MVWGTICCLRDALAQLVRMTVMTGIARSSTEPELTPVTGAHGTAAGVLCSEGCWANSYLLQKPAVKLCLYSPCRILKPF